MKAADILAAKIQRVNSIDKDFNCLTLDSTLQNQLIQQLKTHFFRHELNIEKLKEFVETSKVLESISADNLDVERSTLRQHLLLTEQILNLLLQLPQPKNLDSWIKTKKVQKFITENIRPINTIETIKLNNDISLNQKLRNVLEFALENRWDEKKIALELGLTVKQIREFVAKM